MADNVAITAGSGTTIAADEVSDGTLGSCKVQYVKIMDGTLNGTDKAAVSSDGLLVNLGANNDVVVTNAGTFAVQAVCTNAGTFAVQAVCTNAGTFAVQAAQSGTWTVDLGATDNAVLDAIAASLAGSLTVGLPSGASTAANQTTIIGHVDGIETLLGTIDTDTGNLATSAASIDGKITACNTGAVVISSGSLTANAGTNLNTSALALESGGNLAAATTALQLIDDTVYADDAAFTPGTSKILGVGFEADEGSTDSVDEGDIGAARMTLDRKQIVTQQPHTSGGLATFRSLDLDESEEEVKGSAGQVYKIRLTNFSTSPRYVKVYDNTAAGTTVGSTTPIDTITIPGAASASLPTVITENYGGNGWAFATGITVAATTALADADTGAPSANDVTITVLYK